ncbi:hypothetical protein AT746_01990 [Lacimicrobium alkaliphilum]|uniref:Integrin n=2 Tax=Lacimicrobium alkaliphilum TaxID=1526571 RepID=A0A0U3AEP7_9ALTE|nr:hypothetical protein AT746_01990 [Lacimicrobium alkaliphilum]
MGEMFGASVAIDGNALIVGAPLENGDANSTASNYNTNAGGAGAAYVFTRTDGVWSQQAYLKASNAGARDRFGTSVDLDGNTAVVGAIWERGDANSSAGSPNDKLSNAGAVYVFTRDGNTWGQRAYLKAGNAGHQDEFGSSVSLDGETLVVGAAGEHGDAQSTAASPNRKAPNSGAAYVFTRDQGEWRQQAYLKAYNALRNHQFGISVALSGDRLVVGADQEVANADRSASKRNNNAENTGAAYVFTRDGGLWRQHAYLKASNRGKDDQFGISVTIDKDTIVVGASQEDGDLNSTAKSPNDNAINAGAVYVYQ